MIQANLDLESFYQQLPENDVLKTIAYEGDLKITNTSNKQFKYPTVSNLCLHPKTCYELEFILGEIAEKSFWKCEECRKSFVKEDLCKDFRYKVQNEFNEFVTNIMIIEGKLFNKSSRKARYLNHFTNPQVKIHMRGLYQRYVATEGSINQIIINELKKSQKIKTGTNQRIQYWAFCLQDKVKITIPVRIIGCNHPECYELTSLLQVQSQKQEQFYVCSYPGCDNPRKKIDISTIENLFSSITIDEDLLKIIKQSSLSSMKFVFNYQTQKFEEDVYREQGQIIDPVIQKYFLKNSKEIKVAFAEFQKQVLSLVAQVCQNDLFKDQPNLEKLLAQHKFRNLEINMKDKQTDMIIEQPVRCKNCTNFSTCLDLKSYACEFIKRKLIKQTDLFKCPICQTPFQGNMVQSMLQNYIYLDQNLLFRMFKDLSYVNTTKFQYLGRQYMIQEFQERQVLTKTEYINALTPKNPSQKVEFKSIFCSFNKNQKLDIPLVLFNCPISTVIDFDTFYLQLEKCNFDLSSGLILCKCQTCNTTPIKSLSGSIFYHEAFDYALKKYYSSNSKSMSFSYDFQKDTLTNSGALADTAALKNAQVPKKMGFLDMLNEEEYQKIFGEKKLEGKTFQILSITQTDVFDGIAITYNKDGIDSNIVERKEQMNANLKNDQTLKQYNFVIKEMKLELNNNPIVQNLDLKG
ncbi:unnamed protein product (macronuclear) [Paramecium tetraurelia]|uniref:SP-RING-type domain-containing protein n=1 Tax=Paramecium tetraurelia TaxID=5888 RepID=A0BMF3_PARTE|nr:uncharacterized protein GSPATT00030356001 [Paramecium tetraurelia]CAK59720.1 unnamed protein product [Paramecium tetraurelia]|eukprot:XP_001427118.1 hypothetical protein (macronuclear) [Paramecium tetraurelia strain d4-2]